MAGVELKHVDLSAIGSGQVVHDLDLKVADGEFLVLLGERRSGQAVLRAVQGDPEVLIDRGTLRIGSQVVNEVPPGERDIALLFGPHALYPHMSVADNLAFRLKLRRRPAREVQRRVTAVAGAFGLTELLGSKPNALSAEQRQLVALAGAVIQNPRVLVDLDATGPRVAALDRRLRELRSFLDEPGPAALAVSPTAQGLDPATPVAVMSAGRLLQRGTLSRVREAPAGLEAAAAVADQPLIAVRGALEGGRLRVGARGMEVPGLHHSLRTASSRPVEVVLGADSLLERGERPAHEVTVVAGVLRGGPGERMRRLDISHAGEAEVELAIDPGRVQLFEPGGGIVRATTPSAGEGGATTIMAPQTAPKPPATLRRGRTYVNVGFAAAGDARRIVEPDRLPPASCVWVWVEIGPRVKGAVQGDVQPIDPAVLKDLDEVEVVLFPDEGLIVAPDPATGRLGVTAPGPFRVRRAASIPPHTGPLTTHRLFFTLTTPAKPGDYRLRCAVYAKGLLLHVEQLTVVVGPSRRSISARTAFRLVRDLAAVDHSEIGEHRLSIYANAQPDGSHDFCFRGADGKPTFTYQLQLDGFDVNNALTNARAALHQASWQSKKEYAKQDSRYDKPPRRGFAADFAAADLINLAREGYHLWSAFTKKVPAEDEAVAPGPAPSAPAQSKAQHLRGLMHEPGGAVQFAPNDPDRILPIQLFYDRRLDSGYKTLQLCSNGSAWIGSGADELPCLTGCSEPGDTKRVCPAGFWGLRHRVSLTPESQDVCRRPGLPPKVSLASGLRGVAGYTTDQKVLKAAGAHGNTIKALLKVDRPVYSRDEFQVELEAGPAQVIYFLCHVANHDTAPELVLGPIGGDGINSTTLTDEWAPNLCSGSPLVVLNACNSAAPSPERLLGLVAGFLERGAAGAIGTEITVFVSLAMPFAEHFLQSYVSGVSLGEAIRRARVAMLAKGNPLGLAYIAFGLPELALLADEPARDTPEGTTA